MQYTAPYHVFFFVVLSRGVDEVPHQALWRIVPPYSLVRGDCTDSFFFFCKMNLSVAVLSHQEDESLMDVPLLCTFTHKSEEKVCKMNLSLTVLSTIK